MYKNYASAICQLILSLRVQNCVTCLVLLLLLLLCIQLKTKGVKTKTPLKWNFLVQCSSSNAMKIKNLKYKFGTALASSVGIQHEKNINCGCSGNEAHTFSAASQRLYVCHPVWLWRHRSFKSTVQLTPAVHFTQLNPSTDYTALLRIGC